jgi:hypothetical protein
MGPKDLAAGVDRHGRKPFRAVLFTCAAAQNKYDNFLSALHQLSNECWARIPQKINIIFSFDHWQGITY